MSFGVNVAGDIAVCGCQEPIKIPWGAVGEFVAQTGARYEIVDSKHGHSHVRVISKRGQTYGWNLSIAVQRHMRLYGVKQA